MTGVQTCALPILEGKTKPVVNTKPPVNKPKDTKEKEKVDPKAKPGITKDVKSKKDLKHDSKKDTKAIKSDKTPQNEIANNLSSKLNEVEVSSAETKEETVIETKGETEKKVIECIVDKKEIVQSEAEVKIEGLENKQEDHIEVANCKDAVKEEAPLIIPHDNNQETTQVVTNVSITDTADFHVAKKNEVYVEEIDKKEVANHDNNNGHEIEKKVIEEIIESKVDEEVQPAKENTQDNIVKKVEEKVEEKKDEIEIDIKDQLNMNEKTESAEIQQVETTNSSQEDKQSEIKSEEKDQPAENHNQENSEIPAN